MDPEILLVRERLAAERLRALADRWFGDMVKYVVDLRRGVAAVGGEMHADAEELLLADGSRQEDLWGANYYPGRNPEDCIEYTSLINIRPAVGNPGMEIADPDIRHKVREATHALIGRGEAV